MYSVNDELPEGFFDGQHTGTRKKKSSVLSTKSGRSSKQEYVIEEQNDDIDDDMMNNQHRMRQRIVAIALVFTVAALIAFGVALYFSSMEDPSADLEPVVGPEDNVPSPNENDMMK